MMNRKKSVFSFLNQVLDDQSLNPQEYTVIKKCAEEIEQGTDINRALLTLKATLSALSVKQELSPSGLSCLSEISRREPSTSVSSMWNFMMKKKKD